MIFGTSCTIHKRQYSKGYFVSWKKVYKSEQPLEIDKKQENITSKTIDLKVFESEEIKDAQNSDFYNQIIHKEIENYVPIKSKESKRIQGFNIDENKINEKIFKTIDDRIQKKDSTILKISKIGFYSSTVFLVISLLLLILMLSNVFVFLALFFIPLVFWLVGIILTIFVFIKNRKEKNREANYYAWLSILVLITMLYPLLFLYALANFAMNMPSII
ncbi:MAG: hypothetical protein ACLGGV_08240 [Bacteroidia bacterium]